MNLPNKITLIRICLIPVFLVMFYLDCIPYNYLIAALIFGLAASTDFLDGYIARSRGLVTNLGKFLDPIADKVLNSTAMIVLLTRPEGLEAGVLSGWGFVVTGVCVAVVLARELIISGFRMVAAERKTVLAADIYGKLKTVTQDVALFILVLALSFTGGTAGNILSVVGFSFFALATLLTVFSGVNYIVKNADVLREEEKEQA